MSLYCRDGQIAQITPWTPLPPLARGEQRGPLEPERDRCQHCGETAVFHRPDPPCITDDLDRAIYAAAFVAAMQQGRRATVEAHQADACNLAEHMVRSHRAARSTGR